MSKSAGESIKKLILELRQKNSCIRFILANNNILLDDNWFKKLNDISIKMIKNEIYFSDDLLLITLNYFTKIKKENILNTNIFNVILDKYKNIINHNNKKSWVWLKNWFIKSKIWLFNIIDDDNNDNNYLLFDEIYKLTSTIYNKKTKEYFSDNKKKEISEEILNKLKNYEISETFASHKDIRQNKIKNGLKPIISSAQLLNYISINFDYKRFADNNIYLNQLLFNANLINNEYQAFMNNEFKVISLELGINNNDYFFRSGPVKTFNRSLKKIENDYDSEEYPHSAKLFDCNRNSIVYNNFSDYYNSFELF